MKFNSEEFRSQEPGVRISLFEVVDEYPVFVDEFNYLEKIFASFKQKI